GQTESETGMKGGEWGAPGVGWDARSLAEGRRRGEQWIDRRSDRGARGDVVPGRPRQGFPAVVVAEIGAMPSVEVRAEEGGEVELTGEGVGLRGPRGPADAPPGLDSPPHVFVHRFAVGHSSVSLAVGSRWSSRGSSTS